MIIKFGKYRGKDIKDVPTGHLQSLLATTKHGPTAMAFRRELERRGQLMRVVMSGKKSKKPKTAKYGRRSSRRGPRQMLDFELEEWQLSASVVNVLASLERRR